MSEGKTNSVEQFCEVVTDFSSQYGYESRHAYTMTNLAGETQIYPQYGDYVNAAVLRTYGTYWRRCASFMSYRKAELENLTYSDDFVELQFAKAVYPTALHLFETYNPGTLVRVLALRNVGKPQWFILWKGQADQSSKEAREFKINLRQLKFTTKTLRLEFNSRLCEYYTEFDAVKLIGDLKPPSPIRTLQSVSVSESDMVRGLEGLTLSQVGSTSDVTASDISVGTCNDPKPDSRSTEASQAAVTSDNGFFDVLPWELMEVIFSYFNLETRFQIARVSKLFQQHALYTHKPIEIDLQPFWHSVDAETLRALIRYFPTEKYTNDATAVSARHGLKSLNLSWTGWDPFCLPKQVMLDFFSTCCLKLHSLSLSNCRFVSGDILNAITSYCPVLERLDLSSCKMLVADAFLCIAQLTHLTTLNLYRTNVDQVAIQHISANCNKLHSLNLGSCDLIIDCNQLLAEISKCVCAANFRSLDLWRHKSLSAAGIVTLSEHFCNLEELDIGWSQVDTERQSVVRLVERCTRLRKLFLTARRTISANEILAIAEHLRDLEQLDLLGAMFRSPEDAQYALLALLTRCTKLYLLDLSFCGNVDFLLVRELRSRFPKVNIKKSFQADDRP